MEILLHPVLSSYWVLIVVLAIEQVWIWPTPYHPLTFVRLIATRMAAKVHPSVKRSQYQQRISGGLALTTLLIPWTLLLLLFVNFAEFPYFFDAVLLLIALQFQHLVSTSQKIHSHLLMDKKQLARDSLQPFVLRETQSLSALGIAKANCESLILRFCYQYVAVIFWYLLAGGVGAICYRLIYEFSQSWNTKLVRFRFFGQPAAGLCQLASWLPVRLYLLLIACTQSFSGTRNGLKTARHRPNAHLRILAGAGGALNTELGGPAIYAGEKVRLLKVGSNTALRLEHLRLTISMLNKVKLMLLVLALVYTCAVYALTKTLL